MNSILVFLALFLGSTAARGAEQPWKNYPPSIVVERMDIFPKYPILGQPTTFGILIRSSATVSIDSIMVAMVFTPKAQIVVDPNPCLRNLFPHVGCSVTGTIIFPSSGAYHLDAIFDATETRGGPLTRSEVVEDISVLSLPSLTSHIQVLEPRHEMRVQPGQKVMIRWKTDAGKVRLLLTNNHNVVAVVAQEVLGAEGKYEWTVPDDLAAEKHYAVEVVLDSADGRTPLIRSPSHEFVVLHKKRHPFKSPRQDPWLLVPGISAGIINATSSVADLQRFYGAKNVLPANIDVGEDGMIPGLILFPHNRKKHAEILFESGTQTSCRRLSTFHLLCKNCTWHLAKDVALGNDGGFVSLIADSTHPYIVVKNPKAGDIWPAGSLQKIDWCASGIPINDSIVMTIWQEGTLVTDFENDHLEKPKFPAEGSVEWTVPTDARAANDYVIDMTVYTPGNGGSTGNIFKSQLFAVSRKHVKLRMNSSR